VAYNSLFIFKILTTRATAERFKVLSVSADDASIQLLYKNSLNTNHKHTASHLHDEVNVS